jgi:hypothetical protein
VFVVECDAWSDHFGDRDINTDVKEVYKGLFHMQASLLPAPHSALQLDERAGSALILCFDV